MARSSRAKAAAKPAAKPSTKGEGNGKPAAKPTTKGEGNGKPAAKPSTKGEGNGKATGARKAGRGSASQPSTLRIRMYRVGFGDFFLITVPSARGPQHILIDCGVTKGKTGKGDIASIKSAVRHMAAETNYQLALIIVTHRHQDHIIGFSRCADEFQKFTVEAIWMPYWETELVSNVHDFQADLHALAMDLRVAALAGAPDEHTDEILGIVENATGVSKDTKAGKEGPGGGTNAASLDLLKNKLGVKPTYYYKGQKPELPRGLVEAGLHAHILGPPPPDELEFLRLNDLRKGVGQYLAATVPTGNKPAKITPFGPQYTASADAYPTSAFREWAPRKLGEKPDFTRRYTAALEAAVKSSLPHSLLLAARKLDGVFNNQSLVVLFTWNERKLLFAGDAQAGNWQSWLYDLDKPKTNTSADKLTAAGAEILGSLDFYKVGHHGSTNATPISAVEAMNVGFVAMCSTQHDTFGSATNQSEVPRKPLLDALGKKCTLVRSDDIAITTDTGAQVPAAAHAPSRLPTPKRGKLVRGDCYIDYLL